MKNALSMYLPTEAPPALPEPSIDQPEQLTIDFTPDIQSK